MRENKKSNKPNNKLMAPMTIKTTRVNFQASGSVGQVTLRSSPTVSRHHNRMPRRLPSFDFAGVVEGLLAGSGRAASGFLGGANGAFIFLFATLYSLFLRLKRRLLSGVRLRQQARQDLNPQHPLLESGALPIELLASIGCRLRAFRRQPLSFSTTLFRDAACACGSASNTYSTPSGSGHYDGSSRMCNCALYIQSTRM